MPRMPSRVFAALLSVDSGRATAAELSDALRVSPAAVSGAVRYLVQTSLISASASPARAATSTASRRRVVRGDLSPRGRARPLGARGARRRRRRRRGLARRPRLADTADFFALPAGPRCRRCCSGGAHAGLLERSSGTLRKAVGGHEQGEPYDRAAAVPRRRGRRGPRGRDHHPQGGDPAARPARASGPRPRRRCWPRAAAAQRRRRHGTATATGAARRRTAAWAPLADRADHVRRAQRGARCMGGLGAGRAGRAAACW